MRPQCSIPDCSRLTYARGWCAMHYHRWQRHKDVTAGRRTPLQRFWSHVDPCRTDGCMVWIGASFKGYGQFSLGMNMIPAHHFLAGKPPENLVWDHLLS